MRNNIIKLVFVILISMVFITFLEIPDFVMSIITYNTFSESIPVGFMLIRILMILLSLSTFVFGLLSLLNEKNKVLWSVITICSLLIMIGINTWSIIEYIGYIYPGDQLSIKASNFNYINNILGLFVKNIINAAAIVFAALILNLKEGVNKNEEKCIEELC